MEYFIKNKIFSLKGSSYVKDVNDNDVFKVEGKFFTMTSKKFIYDMNGNLIYSVKNKLFNWFLPSAYVCDPSDNIIAKISRKFSLKSKFEVTGIADPIKIDGDFIGWHFNVSRNGVYIGSITRKMIALTDTFILNVNDDKDAPLLVALVICIDNIRDREQGEST